MRRVFVGLAQVFVGLAAQLRNNRLLQKLLLLLAVSMNQAPDAIRSKLESMAF